MRKNSVRHFIHAVIDVLPLLVIPIFALNILHKETEPISITTSGYEYVELYQTSEPTYNTSTNEYENLFNGYIYTIETHTVFDLTYNLGGIYCKYISWTDDLGYDSTFTAKNESELGQILFLDIIDSYLTVSNDSDLPLITVMSDNVDLVLFDWNVINDEGLTPQIFTKCENIPVSYQYNEGILLNNTDIGSQFVYAMYKPVHDYFNFNNMFNMQGIYDWIQLNLFNGTAPLPVFIIWNIIVYEFFVDLLFLFYAVFMFVIDFTTNLIEKPMRRR